MEVIRYVCKIYLKCFYTHYFSKGLLITGNSLTMNNLFTGKLNF